MTGVSFDPELPTQEEAAAAAASDDAEPPAPPHIRKSTLFHLMASNPWPWLIVMPAIYIALIGSGWSRDDYIEEEVSRIWIPTDGNYYQDQQYANSFDRNDLGRTGFAAMAIARDGGNLFTKERLEEIRARMEKTEASTVEYNGETYTWDDVCALNNVGLGTAYEFPCARLSPMDLFQEARWFFDETDKVTWHQELIHGSLVRPRIPRFGVMQQNCQFECGKLMRLRMDQDFADSQGYPADYANPLSLFADIGNMELNNPCRACIDSYFESTLTDLFGYASQALGVLTIELNRAAGTLAEGSAELGNVQGLIVNLQSILGGLTKRDIEDFYRMYVTRGLYAQLGTEAYLAGYGRLEQLLQLCQAPLVCPPVTITPEQAAAQLLAHADNTFSSVTTAGSPLPFWGQADGTGYMFEGNSPVSGSGVDMSADIFSLIAYLDLTNYGQATWAPLYEGGSAGFADPTSATWAALVDVNPVYAWFMAGETPADNVCGNGNLTGTRTGTEPIDMTTGGVAAASTQDWCTKFSVPTSVEGAVQDEAAEYTKQDFASMWYNLLIDSPSFLGITQGVDDPYSWTTGQGCGYSLQGERDAYTNQTEDNILLRASRELYYVDEGESIGVVDRNLLLGDVSPAIGDYSSANPLTEVGVIQSLYAALLPPDIVERVKNCNRPGSGALEITEDDAEQILRLYKEVMEDTWSEDWDDKDAGDVQFVGFYDDSGVIGTTGRLLKDITLDNNKLTAITIILIMFFSAVFLFSSDLVESKMLVTLVGVALVVLAFFAAVGLAILIGIKINITIAWTLPFIIIGLGVDDIYIVLIALKKQKGYHEQSFLKAMKEVVVPVTMTSAVNCCCFAVLTASDIPAVYLTAQVATICIIALYLAVIFCYPAYCYLDMKRQAANRYDVIFCKKRKDEDGADIEEEEAKPDFRNVWLFDKFYKPLILGTNKTTRRVFHSIVMLGAIAMTACGIWGITEREVGLGLEDFFPYNHQAKRWATVRTAELASWSIGMNWGALDYNDGDTQMKMIKQFEDVVATEHVAELDTKFLWMADMALWSTRQCDENFNQDDPAVSECGRDQFDVVSETNCEGAWVRNKFDLRVKNFQDPKGECQPNEAGICRPSSQMFLADLEASGWDPVMDNQTVWCPIMDWSDDKFQFCLQTWRNVTNFSGGRFVVDEDRGTENPTCNGEFYRDETPTWPMPYSVAPSMYSFDLTSHELTLEMMSQTREVCDDSKELHCWMTGIPYDYWTQYQGIFGVLTQLAGYATAIGFAVSFVFLYGKLMLEHRYSYSKILWGSVVGALLIALTMILSLVSVIGLSVLAGVSLTGFSNMAFVLSVGFAVEYSVHVVSRWLRAPNMHQSAMDRVDYTMSFLMLPTFMSFVSSTIGVVCLAFTEFEFNSVFFFTPLIITMMVTYFFGVWWLPTTLCYLDFDILKLGKNDTTESLYMTASLAKGKINGIDIDELRAVADEDDAEAMEETNNVAEDSASDHSPPADAATPEDTPPETPEDSGEDNAVVKDASGKVKGAVSTAVEL